MAPRRGERAGWYLAWLGGSLWMIWPTLACFFERLWWQGFAALGAVVVNLGLIVYLPPWKHPEVRYWRLVLPILSLQIVMVVAMLDVFQPRDRTNGYLVYQLAFFALLILVNGGAQWDGRLARPEPVAAVSDGPE